MNWTSGLAALGGAVLATIVGLILGRTKHSQGGKSNDLALGLTGGALLCAFALLTGYSIAEASQQIEVARRHTYEESKALGQVYWAAGTLPSAAAASSRGALEEYVQLVINQEWQTMAAGQASADAWSALDRARAGASSVTPADSGQAQARATTLSYLDDLYSKRSQRMADIHSGLPPLVLGGMVAAAILIVLVPMLIGLTAGSRNMILVAFFGAAAAFAVALALQLDGPFEGAIKVYPTAYQQAQQRFEQIQRQEAVTPTSADH